MNWESLSELVKTFLALISGGAIVWAGMLNGWFQRKKVDVDVRKSELEIHKDTIKMLIEERDSLRVLLKEAKETLSLTQERGILRELELTRTIQSQEKRIHILEEQMAQLMLKTL